MRPELVMTSLAAIVSIGDGRATVLHTSEEARAMGDLCRQAEAKLAELERQALADLDRAVARDMNAANAAEHIEYGYTLQGFRPAPRVQDSAS